MFRFIGWVVMTGFALYGVDQFIDQHVVDEKPGAKKTPGGDATVQPA